MKTKISILYAFILLGLAGIKAQNSNNLVVFSETGDRFYLVLNGIKYNQSPETNVKVTNLNATNYKAKILFENGHPDLDHNVYLMWEGNAVTNKEFTYAITRKEDKYKLKFISQADMSTTNTYAQNSVVYNGDGTAVGQALTTTNNVNTNNNTISANTGGGGYNSITTVTTTTSTGTNGQNGNAGVNVNMDGLNMNIHVNGTGTGTNMNTNTNVTTTTTGYTTSTTSYGTGSTAQNLNTNTNTTTANMAVGTGGTCASAMTDAGFNDLVTSIKAKSFEDAKVKVAKQAVSSNCVNTSQVRKLMDLFSFEETKLDITKYCYGYTIDKNNYFKVNDGFTFDSSVDNLNDYISKMK